MPNYYSHNQREKDRHEAQVRTGMIAKPTGCDAASPENGGARPSSEVGGVVAMVNVTNSPGAIVGISIVSGNRIESTTHHLPRD